DGGNKTVQYDLKKERGQIFILDSSLSYLSRIKI
ncbi:unnamed protein product, partial [marine sediment metagenome]